MARAKGLRGRGGAIYIRQRLGNRNRRGDRGGRRARPGLGSSRVGLSRARVRKKKGKRGEKKEKERKEKEIGEKGKKRKEEGKRFLGKREILEKEIEYNFSSFSGKIFLHNLISLEINFAHKKNNASA